MSALSIIDLQRDFCPGGSLAVPDGNDVVEPINSLINSRHWDLIVATKDWHPANHISFASSHKDAKPFDKYELTPHDTNKKPVTSVLWPDHCSQNSSGAEFVPGFDTSKVDHTVLKGQTSEFYSAFADVLKEEHTESKSLLDTQHIKNVVVVGLAYDYCVAQTASDSARAGYNTSIKVDCTRGISKDTMDRASKELKQAGVELV